MSTATLSPVRRTLQPLEPLPLPVAIVTPPVTDFRLALDKAGDALTAFGKACRTAAEQNYLIGAAALDYLRIDLASGPRAVRAAALDNLADEAARWDEDALEVPLRDLRIKLRGRIARLLQVAAAVEALTRSTQPPRDHRGDVIPFRHIRDRSVLVERSGEGNETWTLRPESADAARALWNDLVSGALPHESLVASVRGLQAADHSQQQTEAAALARELREKANAARQVFETAQADPTTPRKVLAKLERKAGSAERKAHRAEQDAEELRALATNARRRVARHGRGPTLNNDPGDGGDDGEKPEVQRRHLLAVARNSCTKDLADLLALLLTKHEHPGEVLRELLCCLDRHPDLDAVTQRLVQALRLQLNRAAS